MKIFFSPKSRGPPQMPPSGTVSTFKARVLSSNRTKRLG